MFSPGPITSHCAPSYPDGAYTLESFVSGRYRETVETETGSAIGKRAFRAEVARIEKVRDSTPKTEWEPYVVRLLHGDLEHERQEIA